MVNNSGSATLSKGLQVLKILTAAEHPPRFSQLVQLTGLPKPTLHRMLSTLVESGMVRVNQADQTYRLGAQLISMAHRVWDDYDLPGVAKQEMIRLQNLTGETVSLGMLSGTEIVYIDQINGKHQIGLSSQLGRREPVHCTAIGKVILAYMDVETRSQILSTIELRKVTDNTIADARSLDRELALVRARGYALDDEEFTVGGRSVAAPILDHTGNAIAAVGLAGPAFRLTIDILHELGPELIETTKSASLSVGGALLPISPQPKPEQPVASKLRCVLETKALLGESPLWCPESNRLFWVDLYAPALHAFDPVSGNVESWPQREITSAVALAEGPQLLLTRHARPVLFNLQTQSVTQEFRDAKIDRATHRFNDARVDCHGRAWAGYMPFRPTAGQSSLVKIEPDGSVHEMDKSLTLPNGLDWNRENSRLYLTDTRELTIYSYDFNADEGTIENKRPFIQFPNRDEGAPDGIAVDNEDHIWVAMWDGWSLKRFDPTGRQVDSITVPVPRPTSLAFGGPEMKTLFITSARIRLSQEMLRLAPLSGSIFSIDVATGGSITHYFGKDN